MGLASGREAIVIGPERLSACQLVYLGIALEEQKSQGMMVLPAYPESTLHANKLIQ